MLVLSRKVGERLVISDHITVVVQRISTHRVSIGIEAPTGIAIRRGELQANRRQLEQQTQSSSVNGDVDSGPVLRIASADEGGSELPRSPK